MAPAWTAFPKENKPFFGKKQKSNGDVAVATPPDDAPARPVRQGPQRSGAKKPRLVIKRIDGKTRAYEGTRGRVSDALEFMSSRKRDMTGLDLTRADLHGLVLPQHTDISGSALGGATLTQLRAPGLLAHQVDLSRATVQNSDFRGAELVGADLFWSSWVRSRLVGVNLNGAKLSESSFEHCHLSGASLRQANMRFVKMTGGSLKNADLRGAELLGAEFVQVDARGADLTGAVFNEGQDLSGLDLRGAVGLGNVVIQTARYQRIEGCRIEHGKLVIPPGKHPDEIVQAAIDAAAEKARAELDRSTEELADRIGKRFEKLKRSVPKPRRPWPDMEP